MTIEAKIRAFLEQHLAVPGGAASLTDDDPLLERGVLDSMGVFQLTSYLEKEFGFQIPDEEIVPEHFESMNSIAAFVRSKQGQ